MDHNKLHILALHPVQYLAPLFQQLSASGFDIEVGYYHQGAAISGGYDPEFGITIKWDLDLLSGYQHRFFIPRHADYSIKEQLSVFPMVLSWLLNKPKAPILFVGWSLQIFWLMWFLAIVFHIPTLVMCDTTISTYRGGLHKSFRRNLLQWLVRQTSACLFVGERNYEFFRSMGAEVENLFKTPFSVDNNRFYTGSLTNPDPNAEWLIKCKSKANLPVILFSGKLISGKRPTELLQAYIKAGLKDKALLLFVGEGVLREDLDAIATAENAENVVITGFINQMELPAVYGLGNLFCLISELDAWGLVVNEAMACGMPVLVTDTVGCAPDLVNDRTGWIIHYENVDHLASVLKAIYDQKDYWSTMGLAARERIELHTYERMVEGIKSALASISG